MPEIIGEVVMPSDFVVPTKAAAAQTYLKTGQLFISGTKLYYYDGSAVERITSVAV